MSIAEKLVLIAENQQKVYDAGCSKGRAEGGGTDASYNDGYAAGEKAQYDAFWDAYQQNGNRTDYQMAFGGLGWTADIFKPKYTVIKPSICSNMFFGNTNVTDLRHLEFDFSNMTKQNGANYMFYGCTNLEHIGVLDFSQIQHNESSVASIFQGCTKLHTVDKVVFGENNKYLTSIFSGCNALKNLTVAGIIVASGMDLSASPYLTKESIESVINALSGSTSGLRITLSKTAKEAAFTEDEWTALIAAKANWTIALV